MGFLSKLRAKLAYWLCPQQITISQQDFQSKNPLEQDQLEKLYLALCTLFNLEQNFIKSTVSCQELKRQTAEVELEIAQTQRAIYQRALLPHTYLGVSLKHDGVSWIATFGYGESLIVGRGDSPIEALSDFDSQWFGNKK